MLRAAGIVALFAVAACGPSTSTVVVSPAAVISPGSWTEQLTFTGEVAGQMSGIVANTATQVSECTGSKTRPGQPWSDSFFGTVDRSGQVWQVTFLISSFGGPGSYAKSNTLVQVQVPDKTMVWQNQSTDAVTLTIDRSQQSGTLDAVLTNATTGKPGVHVTGSWNCRG